MKKLVQNQLIRGVFRFSLYAIQIIALIALLRYTGLMAGIAGTTGSLVLKSGFHDVDIPDDTMSKEFDYEFKVRSINGEVIDIASLKGKVLFVNLWATWCGPCRAEMPTIQSLYEKADHNKVEFIILSIDNPGQEEKVKRYVENKNFTFPVYTPSGHLTDQLAVPSIPTTFVVRPDGKVALQKVGMTNFDTAKFRNYLEKLASD